MLKKELKKKKSQTAGPSSDEATSRAPVADAVLMSFILLTNTAEASAKVVGLAGVNAPRKEQEKKKRKEGAEGSDLLTSKKNCGPFGTRVRTNPHQSIGLSLCPGQRGSAFLGTPTLPGRWP